MSFTYSSISQIIGAVEDLLSMSEPPCCINISMSHRSEGDYENEGDDVESEDDNIDYLTDLQVSLRISFSLKNGNVDIILDQEYGSMLYFDKNKTMLKKLGFDDKDVSTVNSCFRKALKQTVEYDRKQANTGRDNLTPIDRASFGLVSN
jgi:hypothetical protein